MSRCTFINKGIKLKKFFSIIMSFTLLFFVLFSASCAPKTTDNFKDTGKPVIGIAWVPDRNEAFYQN